MILYALKSCYPSGFPGFVRAPFPVWLGIVIHILVVPMCSIRIAILGTSLVHARRDPEHRNASGTPQLLFLGRDVQVI